MSNPKNRLDYIDALRGVAIAAVFVVHVQIHSKLDGVFKAVTSCGQYGVQLFFLISAFTILLSLDRRRGNDAHLISNFFMRRLFRIIPVYWFGILVYTALYGLDSRTTLPGPELWHYSLHVSLLNVLHPMTSSSVVPGGWSISLEVLFYLTIPFLFSIVTNGKRALVFAVFSCVFLPLLNYLLSRTVGPLISVDNQVLDYLYWYRSPLNQVGAFALGFLLFYLVKNENLRTVFSNRALNGFLLGSAFTLCAFLSIQRIVLPPKHLTYAALFCGISFLLSCYQWKFIVNAPLRFLGKISYSCYLIHFMVINLIVKYGSDSIMLLDDQLIRFSIVLSLTFMFTIPLAYLSYVLIECPAMNLGKKVSAKWASRKQLFVA